jgi:hypothetical protein
MLTVETAIDINASKTLVWQTLSKLHEFHQWNSRTHFSSPAVLGEKQTMRVKLFGFWLSVSVIIQTYDSENGLRWQGGIPGLYTGSHYFSLQQKPDGTTNLTQGEDFKGVFVPLMWPFLKHELNSLYAAMNKELKAQCE